MADSNVITRTLPRILLRTGMLDNLDMQTGAVALDPPTSWTKGGGGSPLAPLSATQFYSPGSGISTQAVALARDTTNVFLNQASAAGQVALDIPHTLLAAVYPDTDDQEIKLRVDTLDASDVLQETWNGDALAAGVALTTGAWNFIEMPFTPDGTTSLTGTKYKAWLIRNDDGIAGNVYFDQVHLGVLLDLDRGFGVWRPEQRPKVSVMVGDQDYQAIELAEPSGALRFGYRRIAEGTDRHTLWARFLAEAQRGRDFTIWRDSSDWTNLGGHFRTAVMNMNKIPFDFKTGMPRWGSTVEAMTPLERKLQDLVLQ